MRVVGLRIGLSLLAGALLFLAVPSYGLWPLMWIAAVPELYVARVAATPKRAFLYGWLTGAVAHTGGFYWMDGLLERFGHMAPIEALPIMALLIAYQGLAFGFFSWGVRRAWDRTGAPLVLLAPLVMVAVELLMPQIFPYYLAISQAFVPAVIQIADLTGPLGVTALMLALRGRGRRRDLRRLSPLLAGLARAGGGGRADRRRPRLRRAADAPGRRAPRRRAQGAHRPRAGQRRHPREVGSGGVRAPPGPAPARLGRPAARRRRAGRLAGVVVPVRAAAHVRARLRGRRRPDGAARVRHLAHVRRPHPRGSAAQEGPRSLPVQHGDHDGRRRQRHRQLRQGLPDDVRRVHPVLRPDPLVHGDLPRGLELQPRQRACVVPAAHRGGRLQARPAHLLRGHPAVVRAARGQARDRTRS